MLFIGGILLWGQFNSVNWLDYAPTRFVIWLAGLTKASTRSAAVAELDSRFVAGTINPAETELIADAGLAYQGDLTKPWDTAWRDTGEIRARYAREATGSRKAFK